jgi:hypothetical protein
MQHSGQKRGKIGLLDARAEEGLRSGQLADFVREDVHQFRLRVGPAVGQGAFEVIPDPFIGVQFRGVGREGLQVQSRRAAEEVLHGFAPVNPAIVQQDHEVAGDLAQQLPEEGRDFTALDIVRVEVTVQRAMAALRADGDPRDGGDAVVRIPVPHDRRLAHRTPGPPDRGDQEEARFVDEDKVGAQPRGVFFTRGQPSRFQRAMATSSRSTARRSGFWGLQPSWCRSLPTWLRW